MAFPAGLNKISLFCTQNFPQKKKKSVLNYIRRKITCCYVYVILTRYEAGKVLCKLHYIFFFIVIIFICIFFNIKSHYLWIFAHDSFVIHVMLCTTTHITMHEHPKLFCSRVVNLKFGKIPLNCIGSSHRKSSSHKE